MDASDVESLTPRQKEILRLLLRGFDAKSAGRELGISVHTVNEHLRDARRQLGVSSSREAARILQQSEQPPPNPLGPNEIGMIEQGDFRLLSGRPGANFRVPYFGAWIVILVAAAAIAFSFEHRRALSRPVDSLLNSRGSKANDPVQPSSYRNRKVAVQGFDSLKVSGPFKVAILASAEASRVQLVGPSALLADTIVEVEDNTLVIRFREGSHWSWNPGSGVNAVVFAPRLTAVRVEGAADVELNGSTGETLSAAIDGAGKLVIRELNARNAEFVTGGAGGITVSGNARTATYVVGGSGSIDAKRLLVERATIAVQGAGSAYADVSKTANVSVNGAGRVDLVGGAACMVQSADPQQVHCR